MAPALLAISTEEKTRTSKTFKSPWVERKRAQSGDLELETSTPVCQAWRLSHLLGTLVVWSSSKVCAHEASGQKRSLVWHWWCAYYAQRFLAYFTFYSPPRSSLCSNANDWNFLPGSACAQLIHAALWQKVRGKYLDVIFSLYGVPF